MRRTIWILLLAMLAVGCAPTDSPTPDYEATIAWLGGRATTEVSAFATAEVLLMECESQSTPGLTLNQFLATQPAPTVAVPDYTVIQCALRPPDGTLIRFLAPMASRECHDSRCEKQGHVIVGSVRPVEGVYFEGDGTWLRFSYLPLEEKPYNLLTWEKKDGDWQWVLARQYVAGTEGVDFECVEGVQP